MSSRIVEINGEKKRFVTRKGKEYGPYDIPKNQDRMFKALLPLDLSYRVNKYLSDTDSTQAELIIELLRVKFPSKSQSKK